MSGREGRPKTSAGRGKEAPGTRRPVAGSTSGAERAGPGPAGAGGAGDEAKVAADDEKRRRGELIPLAAAA